MSSDQPRVRMDDVTIERVLRVVEAIPPGRVAAYGEVGAIVGVGPRLVGRILREWGGSVPWWRVTNSHGDHPLLARSEERRVGKECGWRGGGAQRGEKPRRWGDA